MKKVPYKIEPEPDEYDEDRHEKLDELHRHLRHAREQLDDSLWHFRSWQQASEAVGREYEAAARIQRELLGGGR